MNSIFARSVWSSFGLSGVILSTFIGQTAVAQNAKAPPPATAPASALAPAPVRICVHNTTGNSLDWEARDVSTKRFVALTTQQGARVPWRCKKAMAVGATAQSKYLVRINLSEHKYQESACWTEIANGDIAEVNFENGKLSCRSNATNSAAGRVAKILEQEEVSIRGRVQLIGPVQGAKISLVDLRGVEFAKADQPTNSGGFFSVRLKSLPQGGLKAIARGGKDTKNQVALNGTLESQVDFDFDPERDMISLNSMTTLFSELLDQGKGQTYAALENKLKSFFGFPTALNIGTDLNNPYQNLFGTNAFVSVANRDTAFYKNLATEILNDGVALGRFPPAKLQNLKVDFNAAWAADKMAGGIISGAAGFAFPLILSELGFKNDAAKTLELLKEVSARLIRVEALLGTVLQKMDKMQYNNRLAMLNQQILVAKTGLDAMVALNESYRTLVDETGARRPGKTEAQVKESLAASERLANHLSNALLPTMSTINVELTNHINESSSLLRLYADIKMPRLVSVKYFEDLHLHVEKFRTAEAMILAALTAANGPQPSGVALTNLQITYYKNAQATELRFVPDGQPTLESLNDFTQPLGARMSQNDFFWDRDRGMLWKNRDLKFDSRTKLLIFLGTQMPGWKVGSLAEFKELYNAMGGGPGGNMNTLFSEWGFNIYAGSRVFMTDAFQQMINPPGGVELRDWGFYQFFDAALSPWYETDNIHYEPFTWRYKHTSDPYFHSAGWYSMPGGSKYRWVGGDQGHPERQ